MRAEVQQLTIAFIEVIALEEALAREFAHAAAEIEAHGSAGRADTMRSIARYHRIKALEHRGRLAALGEEFDWLLSDPFSADP